MITYTEMLEIRNEELALDALDYPFCLGCDDCADCLFSDTGLPCDPAAEDGFDIWVMTDEELNKFFTVQLGSTNDDIIPF